MIKSSYIPTSIVLTSKAEDKEDVQADAKPHKQEREHESMSRKSVLVEHSQEQIAKSDAKSAGAKKVKIMDGKELAERKSGDDVSVKHRSTVASKKKLSKIAK